jgi:type II secretory pathway pseudopilin PulG
MMEGSMLFLDSSARDGFSLLEMILLVALIAIIVAIAAPNIFASIRAAREARAIANIKTLSETQLMFYGNTGRYGIFQEFFNKNYLPPDQFKRNVSTGTKESSGNASEAISDGTYDYSFRYSTDGQGFTLDADPKKEKSRSYRRFRYRISRTGGKDSGGMGIILFAPPSFTAPPSSAYRPLM